MVLILCGKQAASSKHCCPFCNGFAPWLSPSKPNTIDSVWLSYNEFIASGGKKKEAKNYGYVVNCPLLTSTSSEIKIKNICNPPNLYLMTGTV